MVISGTWGYGGNAVKMRMLRIQGPFAGLRKEGTPKGLGMAQLEAQG
jgi:hypothetical protein